MKIRVLSIITFLCLLLTFVYAQPPQSFRYQGIARDANGEPLAGTLLRVRAGILDQSAVGTLVYQETQSVNTNIFGLFNLSIGAGIVTMGIFSSINWGLGAKYMEVEIDFGSGYISMGSSELLSVPYALYSPGVRGDSGVPGIQGEPGVNGNIWHSGNIIPASGMGADGDYYLQIGTGHVYQKTAGVWNLIANIKGPSGLAGLTGPTGLTGATGSAGLPAQRD